MARGLRIGHARQYRVAGDQGSYALTGQAAAVLRRYQIASDFGAYAVSGQSATLSPSSSQPVIAGSPVTTLALRSTSAGTFPYSATVLPARGAVPSGQTVVSTQDTSLRASILSTWDDGSAAVVIVAGSKTVAANEDSTVALQAGVSSGTNLTTSAISSVVSSVVVNFQGTYGAVTLSNFTSPERTWWANPQVICARYRLAAPTPGSTSLEAVIDIHAYAGGRALVEVVVENGRMSSSSPVKPAAATYTNATVSVNGSTIATVSSTGPTSAEGNHAAFRAWYAKGWVGGDPGLRVTQSHLDLQKHPLLFKADQESTFDFTGYASDAYTAWTTGRQRGTGMGAGGDHASIGPLPQWEARTLQSGDYRGWLATEVNTLACLSYNINYRDSSTSLVPTFTAIGTKNLSSGTWPGQTNGNDAAMWETPHCPAAGLMAFIGRPSPVFIEIAQKIAVWNGSWSADATPGWTAGMFGYWYQTRGRAWGMRSLAHATLITPDALAWKTAAKTAITNNVNYIDAWRTDSKALLGYTWDLSPTSLVDHDGSTGFQIAAWQNHYMAVEMHKAASARLLTGSAQTSLNTLADWLLSGPVRWVNEQASGGWRYVPYTTTLGDASMVSQPTWGAQRATHITGSPSIPGTWMVSGGNPTTYAGYTADNSADTGFYPAYFWSALVAARERGISGASTAWSTVVANISNLSTWRAGFATDPRWGSYPRDIEADSSAWGSGQGTAYKGNETFNALQAVYNGISSSGGWAQLSNTTASTVFPTSGEIDAIAPTSVLRQPTWPNNIRIWGSAAWNGYGFYFTAAGGHFSGYTNDTYLVRLADPVGVFRMHMPAPIEGVYRRDTGIVQAPAAWAALAVSNVSSSTAWGPRGCHQYSGVVFDPHTQKYIFGGDSQFYQTNPTSYGASATISPSLYVMDPFAATPQKAWTRITVPDAATYGHFSGFHLNSNGTMSFRGLDGGGNRYTLNLATMKVAEATPPHGTIPMADQFQAWRHCARDTSNNKTYELSQGNTLGAYPGVGQALYETTSGSYVKVADLPSSSYGTGDNDDQSDIVIVNSKAYIIKQAAAASSNTVTVTVYQVNLSTGAVNSYTSTALSAPDLDSDTTLNGIHGRWSYVPQVGGFVCLLSARTNAYVFRPPESWGLSVGFGSGSDTGTFSSNLWTPARDGTGRVNAASWAITPTGQWFQVAGTRLDTLDASIKSAISGWTMPGSWAGVLGAWSGLAVDQTNSRLWAMNAGGHADSGQNGIYEFNCFKMQWLIERLPSDTTRWSSSYRNLVATNSYSVCPESDAQTPSNPINDWLFDEIFWDNPAQGGDPTEVGVPVSVHTYSGSFYNPNANELISCGRGYRLWRYSLSTHKYTYKRCINDDLTPWDTYSGAGATVFFDETTNILKRSAVLDGRTATAGYNLSTNAWSTPSIPWSTKHVADTQHGRNVICIARIFSDSDSNGQYWVYNLDSQTTTVSGTVQFSGMSLSSFNTAAGSGFYDGHGWCYVPPLNEYWMWHQTTSASAELLKVDPTTTPWTVSRKTTTGSVPVPDEQVCKKMLWMPSLNAVVFVDLATNNVYIYRF